MKLAAAVDPFEFLPLDITRKILGLTERSQKRFFLWKPKCEDLRRLRATCKLFASLVSEAGFLEWQGKEAEVGNDELIKFISSRPETAWRRAVDLTFDEGLLGRVTPMFPAFILQSAEKLQTFEVTVYPLADEQEALHECDLFGTLRMCTNLRHIQIQSFGRASYLSPPTKPLVALTTLSLINVCLKVDKAQTLYEVLPTSSSFPSLQHLRLCLSIWPGIREGRIWFSSEYCIFKFQTLKTLCWSDIYLCVSGCSTLEIVAPLLEELTVYTCAQVTLACPSLTKLCAKGPSHQFQSAVTMSCLRKLTLTRLQCATIPPVLAAASNLQKLKIQLYTDPEGPLSLQRLGTVCDTVVCLHLNSTAWMFFCSGSSQQEEPEQKISFRNLERLSVELSAETLGKPEALSRLRIIPATCRKLRQLDILVPIIGVEMEDEISVVIKNMSKEFPSCFFVLLKGFGKAVLTAKAGTVM